MADGRGRFREIEHTADLGIEAEGDSPAELFTAAAAGFYALIADPSGIEARRTISVSATGGDWEELLHAWLSELLAEFNIKGFIGINYDISNIEPQRVNARVEGEPLDLKRHRFHTEIKAVTYHQLRVWQDGGKWRARVIFDV